VQYIPLPPKKINLNTALKDFAAETMTEEEYKEFVFLCDKGTPENILSMYFQNIKK
jgi:hypothetical protein